MILVGKGFSMQNKNPSIGIVGAGPAGVTLAYELYNQGFRDITIVDKASDVGGQSTTRFIDGHKSELATCYLSIGYRKTMKLIKSVGFTIEMLPKPTVINSKGQKIPKPKPPLSSIIKYLIRWYKWKNAGQIEVPINPQNALPFDQWLLANNSKDLVNDFTFSAGLTAQLYGPVERVTAYNGLQWMRPSLFLSGKFGLIYEIKEGFQNLWREVVKKYSIKTILDTEVTGVESTKNGAKILVQAEGKLSEMRFDSVFIAAPIDKIKSPISNLLSSHSSFDYTYAYSAIWKGDNWPDHIESRAYLPACLTGEFNTPLSVRRDGFLKGRSTGQLVGYVEKGADKESLRKDFISDFEDIVGTKNIEIVEDRIWEYNIRYSSSQIEAGLPGQINKAQGEGNVWYTGGALSHWNVESILNYNHILAKRYQTTL